jgi:protein gp37
MIADIATPMCEAWDCEGVPPCNVWLGTLVEDQRRADDRIPALLKTPAVVHFLSVEPLLAEPCRYRMGNLRRRIWTPVQADIYNGPEMFMTNATARTRLSS